MAVLIADVLSALEAAHTCDVIHRDLKPSNIFAEHQRYVIVDFGLATTPALPLTVSTAAGAGTPAYMPPEQAVGRAATVRTDTYAAGAVLYEALTGRLWSATPSTDEAAWSAVPPAIVPVLQRALAWSPSERWESARSFRDALVAAATAAPPSVSETIPRRLAAVMFTDMVGYTDLMNRNEPAAREPLDTCHPIRWCSATASGCEGARRAAVAVS
jgi:serine/threonine protein kinase